MPPPDVRIALGLLLRRSHQRAATALNDVLEPLGLTGRHFGVMLLLDREGVSSQRDLIRLTGSDKAGMARTIADLEQLGYLKRSRSAEDRRVEDLSLTRSGASAFGRAQELASSAATGLFDGFSETELANLASLLRRFTER